MSKRVASQSKKKCVSRMAAGSSETLWSSYGRPGDLLAASLRSLVSLEDVEFTGGRKTYVLAAISVRDLVRLASIVGGAWQVGDASTNRIVMVVMFAWRGYLGHGSAVRYLG